MYSTYVGPMVESLSECFCLAGLPRSFHHFDLRTLAITRYLCCNNLHRGKGKVPLSATEHSVRNERRSNSTRLLLWSEAFFFIPDTIWWNLISVVQTSFSIFFFFIFFLTAEHIWVGNGYETRREWTNVHKVRFDLELELNEHSGRLYIAQAQHSSSMMINTTIQLIEHHAAVVLCVMDSRDEWNKRKQNTAVFRKDYYLIVIG